MWTVTKEDVLNDLECYKNKTLYTSIERKAELDAKDILETAIENEYDNMYDDWDEVIRRDISQEDIKDIQVVLDRILNKNPDSNIAYLPDKEIEIDVELGSDLND